MQFSDDLIAETKKEFKDEYNTEMSDSEVNEALNSLANLFGAFAEMEVENIRKQNRLKKEPKGFPIETQHNCIVCHRMIDPETGWYDHNKQKCLSCQKAVDEGVLPSFICHHKESFFLTWELKEYFKIHSATARKLVREEKLIARVTRDDQNKVQEYIFLKKENPDLIRRYNPVRKSYDRHKAKLIGK